MRFLVIILLIAAATAAPSGGNGEDQSTKGSPAAPTSIPSGGNGEDQSTKDSSPPTGAQDSHSEHDDEGNHKVGSREPKEEEVKEKLKEEMAGNHKVEGHDQKVEQVKEEDKEEAKENVKEYVKGDVTEDVKKGEKKEDKAEVKEEVKETNQDDFDWEKRELKYQMDETPACAGKVEYKISLNYGNKVYTPVEEVEKHIAECQARVDILSERGNKLKHYYVTKILMCGIACEFHSSDMTNPLSGKLGDKEKSGKSLPVKTKEQEEKIEQFVNGIKESVNEILRAYTKQQMEEVNRFNDNRIVRKAIDILKARKEMEKEQKKSLEKQKKEKETEAKQIKVSASEGKGGTVDSANQVATARGAAPTGGAN